MLSSSTSRTAAVGNDAANVYNYGFRIKQASDLLVTVRNLSTNLETVLTLTTDYTVQNVGQASGTITLVNNGQVWLDQPSGDLSSSYKIIVRRTRPLQQNTNIRNQGTYFASVHEDEFDDLVMQVQYLWDYVNRAVILPETAQPADFNPILRPQDVFSLIPGATLQVGSDGKSWAFGSPQLGWLAVDIPYSAFSAASTSQQFQAFSLPAGCILIGVALKHTVAFAGPSIASLTIDLGTVGNPTLYLSAFNAFQAVGDTTFANAAVNNIQSFGSPTAIMARAVSGGANLSALTQGSVRVFYWIMNL